MADWEQIERLCRIFIARSFGILGDLNILPVPRFSPYLRIGRDYFGEHLSGIGEFGQLEDLLAEAYPDRFADPIRRSYAEFPSHYLYSLLEAAIAGCVINGGQLDATSDAVTRVIVELREALERDHSEVVCCRVVSHLRTLDRQPLLLGDVEVIPDTEDVRDSITPAIAVRIAGATSAYNRERPFVYDPPLSVLACRGDVPRGDSPFEKVDALSARLDAFLLVIRILYSATTSSYWQVSGLASLIGDMHPHLQSASSSGMDGGRLRRIAILSADHAPQIATFQAEMDSLDIRRTGMAATSFDSALQRFNRSFGQGNVFDKVVDLCTALEGILLGGDKDNEAILLRLRIRASSLLLDDNDPADQIDTDITQLYALRSTIVHGGDLKDRRLRGMISRVSSVTDIRYFGLAMHQAVDRLRDLVRRAILARIFLAKPGSKTWPLAGAGRMDVVLANDGLKWREAWRSRIEAAGLGNSAGAARRAAEFVSTEER